MGIQSKASEQAHTQEFFQWGQAGLGEMAEHYVQGAVC